MRVLHVVPGILELASGTSYTVPSLCQALAARGLEQELHAIVGKRPLGADYPFFSYGSWSWPPRLDVSPRMHRALKERAKNVSLVHSNGLWNMANIYSGWAASAAGRRHIISPHGTLGPYPLRRSRWKKRIIWHIWQRRILERAACIHATCEAEYGEVREVGILNPVAVIPNGIDVPELPECTPTSENRMRRLLFLGRITPKKGIDILLRAWAAIQHQFADWELHITGIDDRGHEEKMKALAADQSLNRVRFTGPVYGRDKTQALLSADVFILPTHSENFGISVAEALAHNVPAIVTKGAPWEGLERYRCGWWTDIGTEPLVECLKAALAESPESLRARGQRGRAWMQRDFSWAAAGERMHKTYEWLINGGDIPQWVRLN